MVLLKLKPEAHNSIRGLAINVQILGASEIFSILPLNSRLPARFLLDHLESQDFRACTD